MGMDYDSTGVEIKTFGLTEDEVKLIVECLQFNERNSRRRFADKLADDMGRLTEEALADKLSRQQAFLRRCMDLRAKLGDATVVHVDNQNRWKR